jgi:hypothetical protein
MMLPMAARSNSYLIYDGTTESTSRGGTPGTNAAGILVRYPANQYLGALGVVGATYILQDQDFVGRPMHVRRAWSRSTRPDQRSAGHHADGHLGVRGSVRSATFPTPASGIASAAYWTVTFGAAGRSRALFLRRRTQAIRRCSKASTCTSASNSARTSPPASHGRTTVFRSTTAKPSHRPTRASR